MPRGYRSAFVAIGLIAAIANPCLGQDEQPQRNAEGPKARQESSDDHKAEPGPEDQTDVPIEVSETDPGAEDTARDHQDRPKGDVVQSVWAWDGLVTTSDTFAQWIMAFFGVVATGVSVWAVILLKRTLKESRRATETALRAAEAAEQTVEVTRDIGQRQIRAYMVANTADMVWVQGFDESETTILNYGIRITWKNCGDTPARRCRCHASVKVFDDLIPQDYEYPDLDAPGISIKNHVGPDQTLLYRLGGICPSDVLAAEKGQKHIYAWSWVEYDDIFAATRRRTEACFKLHISRGGATCFPSIAGSFNGADEDCQH